MGNHKENDGGEMLVTNHVLEQKTNEFIKALMETPEYLAYKKAQEEFDSDNEAKQLVDDFNSTQQTYNVFRQGDFQGIKEQKERLEKLKIKLEQNTAISEFLKSENDLQVLISDLANKISEEIGLPFNQPAASCCG
jgi:cell fate (sporulation/competence/biofilm development) regulator YlbF (YheA/YmcA/DUF963 family)